MTIRMRLTAWYGLAFLFASVVLVLVIYVPIASRPAVSSFSGTVPDADSSVSAFPVDLTAALAEQRRAIEQQNLRRLFTQSLLALGVAGLVAVCVGWFMAGRALRPLHRITATARRVADRSLHERIGLTGPRDELKELADTFDAMLERLDRAFDGQRRFVANASHELRTPLAISRAVVEFADSDPQATPQVRQLTGLLLANNARQERLLDGLLTLARSETRITSPRPVDLADLVSRVVDQLTTEAEQAEVAVQRDLEPATCAGDPVLLERLATNLVENAIRHNPAGGWVNVAVRPAPGGAELTVVNSGTAVAAYEVPDLFEPFHRGSGAQAKAGTGVGLGLSIVRAIANAHGGTVHAQPREGGGLLVRVTIPPEVAYPEQGAAIAGRSSASLLS